MADKTFRCYLVDKDADGRVHGELARRSIDELPAGDVLISVAFSSLNYKDALGAKGHPGVNKVFPYIPGVDAAGTVVQSASSDLAEGDRVLVTGFEMGMNRWGGLAGYVRVPRDWVVPVPAGLSLYESMALGTAGLTAALSVHALQVHGISPERGEVVVTGASGGVGSVAVALLGKLGYRVAAITGKASAHEYLRALGATEILGRDAVTDTSGKPLLSGRWSGAIDTVGGGILATVIASMRHGGCIAACGNVAGGELRTSVFPFILRGITLTGIDTAVCPTALRHLSWKRLGGDWKPDQLDRIGHGIELDDLPARIDEILAGQIVGRTVVRIGPEGAPPAKS